MLNKDGQRELAYVVTVDDILPIPGKDRVECAIVGGWTIEELPKGISFDEYLDWREAASVARDKYIKGELTAEEALKIIEVKD